MRSSGPHHFDMSRGLLRRAGVQTWTLSQSRVSHEEWRCALMR